MSNKALIIAVENYPDGEDVSRKLSGTNRAAGLFARWVVEKKGVSPENVWVCAKGARMPAGVRRAGTAYREIKKTLKSLVEAGFDQTRELFVYYAGHGFCYSDSPYGNISDLLVASDYVARDESGDCCFSLQQIADLLWSRLGGRDHYYFIDACRSILDRDAIVPGALSLRLPPARKGRPTRYKLYSAEVGEEAYTDSGFAYRLVDALNGKDGAKDFDRAGSLWVQFRLVAKYVSDHMRGQTPYPETQGMGEGNILQIVPVPTYKGRLRIEGAPETGNFVMQMRSSNRDMVTEPFQGATHEFQYTPDSYAVKLKHDGRFLSRQREAPEPDFFDDGAEIVFTMAPAAPSRTLLRPLAGAGATVRASRLHCATRSSRTLRAGRDYAMLPGTYELRVRDPHREVASTIVDLGAGIQRSVDLLLRPGKTRAAIVRKTGAGDPVTGVVDFSEKLGEMHDRDLSLWLTLIGAARLLRPDDHNPKMQAFSLPAFDDLQPRECRLWMLTGFEGARPCQAAVKSQTPGRGATKLRFRKMPAIPGLPGVRQSVTGTAAGVHLISFRETGQPAWSFVTYCLPGRVTLAVFSEDGKGRRVFRQFVLPVHHLQETLPGAMRKLLNGSGVLAQVRALHQVQNEFANYRAARDLHGDVNRAWKHLLAGRWRDPVLQLIPAYDAMRTGEAPLRQRVEARLLPALRNYAGLPDASAMGALLDLPAERPPAPPLLREGLAAFPGWEDHLPLPATHLDYGTVWTCWRGGV